MDLIVFSKDRAFQLHTSLETITKYVKGVDNIFVLFSYSNKKFYDGYLKLNNLFDNVTFIDETQYGFHFTLRQTLVYEVKSDLIALEVDDTIYFNEIDLSKCGNVFLENNDSCKYSFGLDYKLFDKSIFEHYDNYVSLDKWRDFGSNNLNLVLQYPFNVSSVIHRKEDILKLMDSYEVKNPVELEWRGSDSEIFKKYKYSIYHKQEVVKQIHINNFLKRYEDVYGIDVLNDYFLNGEVIDISKINVNEFESDMRWFNGEDIGRFPIFPWEIAPKYHQSIIENRRLI